nr:translation initiation factor IF-2 N-terminal domain-containing protein [Corynebacterium sp. 13CS0277]
MERTPLQLAAETYDRTQLGAKIRVHALAKQLGVPSKDVIAALDVVGLVKVAQSTLSTAEAERLLDSLLVDAHVAEAVPAAGEDKIRQRVEKNVANEIQQIEAKVDEKLVPAGRRSDVLSEAELEDDARAAEDEELAAGQLAEAHAPAPLFQPPTFVAPAADSPAADAPAAVAAEDEDAVEDGPRRRRRGRRGASRGKGAEHTPEDVAAEASAPAAATEEAAAAPALPTHDEVEVITEPKGFKGSTRLEAQRRRRNERRKEGREKRVLSEEEFLARRESVHRTMVVRDRRRTDHPGLVTQVGVLEDGLLVEHFVTSETQATLVGNIYLGRVQNVLASMEAAFIDIGKGRNGVLYAGEVDWRSTGLGGRSRKIEQALKAGDYVLVQVTKDPVGQKGARLTTQISLAGRFLVYVPGGKNAGISRKLPEPERKRLKEILRGVVPKSGGAIVRTAAEGVAEKDIEADVLRLHGLWEDIKTRVAELKKEKTSGPVALYEEPDMLVKVVRDLFNEDFEELVVEGRRAWNTVSAYVKSVAPDLVERLTRYEPKEHDGKDVFAYYRLDEQLHKALSRKVWLPSGGTLVIDRTEAMTVIDVNTGKFTGSGGNLEETVTKNNLEAAEEIVRQMRLRDMGGMIVVDFIDMVLPENQDLVLRRLTEALGRDRTRHQVSEVTSLGLVQMTRKKLGTGLVETFSTECEACEGRGIVIHEDPVEHHDPERHVRGKSKGKRRNERSHEREHAPEQQRTQAPAAEDTTPQERRGRGSARDVQVDSAIESLAASIVADDDNQQPDAPARGEESSSARRRRRRRGAAQLHEAPVGEESADAIAAIAAAAVAVADEEDPDEPSGADHLAEDAAAASAQEQPAEGSRGRRRRSGASRRGAKQRAGAAVANEDADVDVRVHATPAEDPQQDVAAAGLEFSTYAEALAAFEASPRRKRATRGNSRSDTPPRPEDYPDATSEDVDEFVTASTRSRRSKRTATPEAPAAVEAPAEDATAPEADQAPAARTRRRKAGAQATPRRRRVAAVALGEDLSAEELPTEDTAQPPQRAGRRGRAATAAAPAEDAAPVEAAEDAPKRRTRRRAAGEKAAATTTRRRAVKVVEVTSDLSTAVIAGEDEPAQEATRPKRTRRSRSSADGDTTAAPAKKATRAKARSTKSASTAEDAAQPEAEEKAPARRTRRRVTKAADAPAQAAEDTPAPARRGRRKAAATGETPAPRRRRGSSTS